MQNNPTATRERSTRESRPKHKHKQTRVGPATNYTTTNTSPHARKHTGKQFEGKRLQPLQDINLKSNTQEQAVSQSRKGLHFVHLLRRSSARLYESRSPAQSTRFLASCLARSVRVYSVHTRRRTNTYLRHPTHPLCFPGVISPPHISPTL